MEVAAGCSVSARDLPVTGALALVELFPEAIDGEAHVGDLIFERFTGFTLVEFFFEHINVFCCENHTAAWVLSLRGLLGWLFGGGGISDEAL